jgi:hypothetical protein
MGYENVGWITLRYVPSRGTCKHGYDTSGSIRGKKRLGYLNTASWYRFCTFREV